jgi:hypothetical protein
MTLPKSPTVSYISPIRKGSAVAIGSANPQGELATCANYGLAVSVGASHGTLNMVNASLRPSNPLLSKHANVIMQPQSFKDVVKQGEGLSHSQMQSRKGPTRVVILVDI